MTERSDDRADPRLHDAARSASGAVQQAAGVLEEQLSAGLSEVRRMTATFADERRLDSAAFEDLVARFRSNAHDLIEVAARRVEDLRSDEAQDLARRFSSDAHDVFDTVLDLVVLAPSILRNARGGRQATDEQGNVDPNDGRPMPPKQGGGDATHGGG